MINFGNAEFERNTSFIAVLGPTKQRSKFCSQRITRVPKKSEHAYAYSTSNKLQRVCVCLNLFHLFDKTDKNMTLVSKNSEIMRFKRSLLATSRKHCSSNARPDPERLYRCGCNPKLTMWCPMQQVGQCLLVLLANTFLVVAAVLQHCSA